MISEKLDNGLSGDVSGGARRLCGPTNEMRWNVRMQSISGVRTGKADYWLVVRARPSIRCVLRKTRRMGKGLYCSAFDFVARADTHGNGRQMRNEPINAICICSDPQVAKKRVKDEDTDHERVVDLALPASTDVKSIVRQFRYINDNTGGHRGMTVVFSTYQSIDVIASAQKELLKSGTRFGAFDLIICDEAHRTTGVTLSDEDELPLPKYMTITISEAKKRLYMTATPRLYSDDIKSKAAQADAVLCRWTMGSCMGRRYIGLGLVKQ